MPLLQLYNSMKEKAQTATQPKKMASSPEPFSTPEDEFGDFIWNNGPRKKPLQPTESDHVSSYAGGGRVQEIRYNPGAGNFAVKLAEVVPMAPDELFVPTKRSVQVGLSMQDDDAGPGVGEGMDVPWITYNPTEEGLPREFPQQDDYCAVFLREFSSGFDLNGSTFRSPADHRSSCRLLREVRRSEHGRVAKTAAAAGICCRPQDLSHHHGLLNGSIVVPEHCKPRANDSIERLPQQQQKQERRISPISPCRAPSSRGGGGGGGGGGLINFSHFMRPFALAKGSLEGNSDAGGRLPSGHETTSGSKPPEKTLVDNGSAFKCISTTPPPLMADAKPAARAPHQEAAMVNVDQSGAFSREDHGNTRKQDAPGHDLPSSSFAASAAMSRHERKRLSQASEASSSCSSSSSSGNSHGEAPNHYKRRMKRKHHEEESEESGHFMRSGAKKHVYRHRAGTKWSRAATEVHNVSERRRRDRINERMRALQELIPNCNKVDKASMLQEAIEYLKSLQFQLQMMSMGTGSLYMPQTVARGMQLFGMPTVAPFPAVGMGLGFGMGMYDMNSSSTPLFPVPPVYAQRFGPAVMPRLPLDALLALSMKANMVSGSPRTSAQLKQQADPMMAAVSSDQDKRGKDLHGEAVQKPNYC